MPETNPPRIDAGGTCAAARVPNARVRDRNSRRILAAVRQHMDVHGIDEASMQQIAAAADVSVRTLYNLFGDRDGLVRALLYQSIDAVDIAVGELESNDPIERVWDSVDRALQVVEASLPRSVLVSVLADEELVRQLSQRWHVSAFVAEEIRRAQKSGALYDDVAAEVLVDQVGMTLLFLLRSWAAGLVDDDELRAAALHSVDLCLLAIAKPRTRAKLRDHANSLQRQLPDLHLHRRARDTAAS